MNTLRLDATSCKLFCHVVSFVHYLNHLTANYTGRLLHEGRSLASGVARKSGWGPSPFPFSPFPFSPFPFRSSFPSSLLLEAGPHIAVMGSGERLNSPSGSEQSLAAKRFWVHFKHYFNRERIEN